jgi:glycerate dehydrogenase
VLSAEIIGELPDLKFISVLATGYNIVDTAAARKKGIPVSNVPVYSTDSVAQLTFALILELCHHVGLHTDSVMKSEWASSIDFCYWKTPLIELAGKKMGIVGFGRIGRKVGELAHAFGMDVLAASRSRSNPPEWKPFRWAGIDEVFAESDIVSLHVPLTPEIEGMVNASLLSKMRPSSFLINTSRGGLVNEGDLAEALKKGIIAGAGVDVVSREPILRSNPLLDAPNLVITPHFAWATFEARKRLMRTTAENIRAFLDGEPVNVVN